MADTEARITLDINAACCAPRDELSAFGHVKSKSGVSALAARRARRPRLIWEIGRAHV